MVKFMSRVYICHTYYHAYIAVVKELNIRSSKNESEETISEEAASSHVASSQAFPINDKATLILSTMSNDFGALKERAEKTGLFKDIYMFDEKPDTDFPEVMKYHEDKGNLVSNMLQRIKYTRLLGKLQEKNIPVDLKKYDDVYVFCDSDPIGFYLNYKKIKYHAIEDGLNTCLLCDQARVTNKGAFGLKCFMSKLGLIFIENGYGRYCIDYEVNDIKANPNPPKNIVEKNRNEMFAKLSDEDKNIIISIFMENSKRLMEQLSEGNEHKSCVLILTEPLCDMDVRKKLFGDIISEYKDTARVIIKPHPRDLLDYEKEFPDTIVIKGKFPMEVMNDIPNLHVDKLISVITQVDSIKFADEIVYLGFDFLDKYEAPEIHRV